MCTGASVLILLVAGTVRRQGGATADSRLRRPRLSPEPAHPSDYARRPQRLFLGWVRLSPRLRVLLCVVLPVFSRRADVAWMDWPAVVVQDLIAGAYSVDCLFTDCPSVCRSTN